MLVTVEGGSVTARLRVPLVAEGTARLKDGRLSVVATMSPWLALPAADVLAGVSVLRVEVLPLLVVLAPLWGAALLAGVFAWTAMFLVARHGGSSG